MSELWIPSREDRAEVSSVFDLMLHFQNEIDAITHRNERLGMANIAIGALRRKFNDLSESQREVTVVSDVAYIDSVEEEDTILVADNIGMSGSIADVQIFQVGESIPMSVSLALDVHTIFKRDSPEDRGALFGSAKAPIGLVQYIETLTD